MIGSRSADGLRGRGLADCGVFMVRRMGCGGAEFLRFYVLVGFRFGGCCLERFIKGGFCLFDEVGVVWKFGV